MEQRQQQEQDVLNQIKEELNKVQILIKCLVLYYLNIGVFYNEPW